MAKEWKILGISGSLRAASWNTLLLRVAAEEFLPEEAVLTLAEIGDLPLYNADLKDEEVLAPVERLKQQIAQADALLMATPEYNYGVSAPLKNAIDWCSRPAYKSVFRDKPVGIVGATPSQVGTARAQGQLKQILLGMVAQVFPYPEFLLSPKAFDEEKRLSDERMRERLHHFMTDFVSWGQRVQVR